MTPSEPVTAIARTDEPQKPSLLARFQAANRERRDKGVIFSPTLYVVSRLYGEGHADACKTADLSRNDLGHRTDWGERMFYRAVALLGILFAPFYWFYALFRYCFNRFYYGE